MSKQEYQDSGWYAAYLRELEYERSRQNNASAAGTAATAAEVELDEPPEEEPNIMDPFSESDQQ